ncbi:hypothetical protein D9C73_011510 [Collichthys lucidus]|uniref:Uncharacterized protein n=1 Tax=Collichthys lucidus TaxID=240159 RepID=A0A4U5URB8_COLLU|nr:hypothetical protein D9C73_011510 [Collichthys lucidus]
MIKDNDCYYRIRWSTLMKAPDAYSALEKFPLEDKKLWRRLDAVTRAACTVLCGRQTDRLLWSFDSHDRRTRPAIRFCAQQPHEDPGSLCAARLLNHRNYFQRQPEHVEDEFMHHNGEK